MTDQSTRDRIAGQKARAWAYRLLITLLPLLVAFGVAIDQTQIAAILAFGAALLGNGLAAANTPKPTVRRQRRG